MLHLLTPGIEDDPLWYKNAVIYQLHVRAFHDSDGDGIGDFRGLTQKLEYLQDLGVTALWLLPFYPSPLRDDGYDIADYTDVHPSYGTLRDFREFISEAHKRGLRVITELVLNHTSDQHPWFQRARRARPGTTFRDFYVWSDTDDRYSQTRIIFKDFENSNWAWDHVAQAYYWHRFYSHQPDLNFENPSVHRALLRVLDFWFNMGIDGLRLDAVPYLYEREGTTCENLPETHEFLKKLRAHVDARHRHRMLLAEANQWPEDAIAYFGDGDECHMAFHFPLMPRLFMGIQMEDRFPIIDILQQTPEIPENCQWAVFLRNHDELTLEMVTDEERDYMYRVYAHDKQARINLGIRRRLAPLLQNNRRKVELMNGLLFSLGGTPVIYYGDEIGMGDNVYLGDRNGVRTPMQWSPDRNAGFSRANPQRLYLPVIIDPEYHYETVNVEAQMNNPSSTLWWMRRLITLRQRYTVFGYGSIEFLHPENPRVLAFLRHDEVQNVLVVANLSRFAQAVEMDLSRFNGRVPVELFGMTRFPPIGELPYFLTLGPHAFYWFALEPQRTPVDQRDEDGPPTISVASGWEGLFRGRARRAFESALPRALSRRRWFGGKARTIQDASITDLVPIPITEELAGAAIALVKVTYTDAEPEWYQIPLVCAAGERAEHVLRDMPGALIAHLKTRSSDEPVVVCDGVQSRNLAVTLLEAIVKRRRFAGEVGEIRALPTRRIKRSDAPELLALEPTPSRAEQSNSSILYDERLMLKVFRRAAPGVNPDVEIGVFLTERVAFPHTPDVAGWLEYRAGRDEPATLAVLQEFVVNEGDAWEYTLRSLSSYFERVVTDMVGSAPAVPAAALPPGTEASREPPVEAVDAIGPYLQSAALLGQRTAELHLALSRGEHEPEFASEAFTPHHERSLYQSMRTLTRRTLQSLRKRLSALPENAVEPAQRLLQCEEQILKTYRSSLQHGLGGRRLRIHGDYHLGQVLYTGRDFIIIDFEGEPARPLSERRMKRSPLRDVAGMLRSFDYAAFTALEEHERRWGLSNPQAAEQLAAWGRFWRHWVSALFLGEYFALTAEARFLPPTARQAELMLEAFLLEKGVYELEYELNNRPDWVQIPLDGILSLLAAEGRT